jgi:hypothetical protein
MPTELADGLRLEGVSLALRFAPKIGSSASYPELRLFKHNAGLKLGYIPT